MDVKKINTGGISYLESFFGTDEWYWGTDYTSGDLYEAEELYRDGHEIRKNRMIFVRRRDGAVKEPVKAENGQYFGKAEYLDGKVYFLLADFPEGKLIVFGYEPEDEKLTKEFVISRAEVTDCYNLMLHTSPVMLTRQAENRFQIVWPEKVDFPIGERETFCFRNGENLYFERWYEDPDYREETVIRNRNGEIVDTCPGSACRMQDGQLWIIG